MQPTKKLLRWNYADSQRRKELTRQLSAKQASQTLHQSFCSFFRRFRWISGRAACWCITHLAIQLWVLSSRCNARLMLAFRAKNDLYTWCTPNLCTHWIKMLIGLLLTVSIFAVVASRRVRISWKGRKQFTVNKPSTGNSHFEVEDKVIINSIVGLGPRVPKQTVKIAYKHTRCTNMADGVCMNWRPSQTRSTNSQSNLWWILI